MQWTPNVSAGDWLREQLDEGWSTPSSMHIVVPHGFEAYARILHSATRDRPVGRAWPPLPMEGHRREWDAFAAAQPEIDTEHVRWSDVARAFGAALHLEAQWHRLIGRDDPYNGDEVQDAAGWRYQDPQQGRLEPETLTGVATHLAAHTTTPNDGFVALWEGWGGVLGFEGSMSTSARLTSAGGDTEPGLAPHDPTAAHHEALLYSSIHNPWNDGYAKGRWIPGLLADEVSRGPRLELPDRDHVLFTGGINEFVDASWPEHAPWRDPNATWFTHSPSLIWPADHAWALVTEIDFDSTVIGGSAALIAALCNDPDLEAFPLGENADLSAEGDSINK